MSPVKISIIVPVYNKESSLSECIDSLLCQTYDNMEILLIDDESGDSSGKICDEYGGKNDKVRVFHIKNSGPGGARNKGIDEAEGEFVTFVDADDIVDADFLEQLAAGDNLNYDVVYFGWVMECDGKKDIHALDKKYAGDNFCKAVLSVDDSFSFENNSNNMIRRSLLRDNSIRYREGMRNHEDDLFTYSYAEHMKDFVILPIYPYHLRYDDDTEHLSRRKVCAEEEYKTYSLITKVGLKLSDDAAWKCYLYNRFFHIMDYQLFYKEEADLKKILSSGNTELLKKTKQLYKKSGIRNRGLTKYDLYYLFTAPIWFIICRTLRHAVPGRTVS